MTEPQTKTRSEILKELKDSEATWYIKNNTRGQIVNSSAGLSLGPAGSGEHIAILSEQIFSSLGIQRMWSAGKLTISDDPALEQEMYEGGRVAQKRYQTERQNLVGTAEIEEPASNRDLIEKRCLITGERVYQTYAEIKNMVPPLAPAHKDRAHEFTPTVSQDEKGNEVVSFNRVTIEQ